MTLLAPKNLRLWGASPSQVEKSRRPNSLRLTWDLVADATAYDLRTDGVQIIEASPDHLASGLSYCSVHKFEVRSKNALTESGWSPEFVTVTRPPTPNPPKQDDRIPTVYGISLSWDSSGSDPKGLGAYIDVWRKLAGKEKRINLCALELKDHILDESDPAMSSKHYWIKIVVPNANIPGNPMAADNESFPSHFLTVSGPIFRKSISPVNLFFNRASGLRRWYGGPGV